jgi:hypothetical protein
MSSSTRARVAGEMPLRPLRTLLTVPIDTLASRAMRPRVVPAPWSGPGCRVAAGNVSLMSVMLGRRGRGDRPPRWRLRSARRGRRTVEDDDREALREAGWRRRWDLNPRYPYGYSTLAGWCTRPNYATSPDVPVHCTGRGGMLTSPPPGRSARTGGAARLSPIRRTRSVCLDACAGPDRLTPRVSLCQPRDVPLAHVAAAPDPPNRCRSPPRTRRRREPPVGENEILVRRRIRVES